MKYDKADVNLFIKNTFITHFSAHILNFYRRIYSFEFQLTTDELLLGISELGGRRPDPLQGWEPAAEPSERSFVNMEILLFRMTTLRDHS